VEWLLATHESGGVHGPVDWSDPQQRGREGLDVRGADLCGVDLRQLPLAGLHASLTWDKMAEEDERALDAVDAAAAVFSQANLRGAHLEGAWLRQVDLSGTDLRHAKLTRAELYSAYLAGARLGQSHLAGASLRRAVLSANTNLYDAQLSDATWGAARLRDIRWNGVDVTVIEWAQIPIVGDEQVIYARRRPRRNDFPNAARAYRQLAVLLRSQGLSDDADRFAYRAQVMQRRVYRTQHAWGRWFLQTGLGVLAGYGYRLWRIFVAYLLIVGLFTLAFLVPTVVSSQATPTVPQAVDALQISLNAIHGRVFFAQFHLDTVQSWLATAASPGCFSKPWRAASSARIGLNR
jgi:hypothetical protein